jgi:hypothetical protein
MGTSGGHACHARGSLKKPLDFRADTPYFTGRDA